MSIVSKNILLAIVLFLAPFLPYVHLFYPFEEPKNTVLVNFWRIFNIQDHYQLWLYNWLVQLSTVILFSLWLANAKPSYKKPLKLLVLWQLLRLYFEFFSLNYDTQITLKLAALGLLLIYCIFNFNKVLGSHFSPKNRKVSVLLLLIPVLANVYYLVPAVEKGNFLSVEVTANGFNDLQVFCYVFWIRCAFFIAILIWFLNEKQWWRFALLAGLLIFGNQIINLLFFPHLVVDEFELSQSGPYLAGLGVFLIVLTKAVSEQEKVKLLLLKEYKQLEGKIRPHFSKTQETIDSQRDKLKSKSLELHELLKIKETLEKELKGKN